MYACMPANTNKLAYGDSQDLFQLELATLQQQGRKGGHWTFLLS